MERYRLFLLIILLFVASCSSVHTIVNPDAEAGHRGLVYYMPSKQVVVKLTVGSGKRTVSIDSTAAYPDTANRYVAQFRVNQLGKNKISIKTSESGLLTGESSTSTVSQVSDFFSSSAGTIGAARAPDAAANIAASVTPCDEDGTYSWIFDPTVMNTPPTATDCNIVVDIKRLTKPKSSEPKTPSANTAASGFFYRRPVPYEVTVKDNNPIAPSGRSVAIVVLPTKQSAVEFLPVSQSFFAVNEGKFSFDNGMPTSYSQELDSEWLGLVKLPAEVLGAYFKAVGETFTAKKGVLSNEQQYLAQINTLAAQQLATRICMQALATQDTVKIKEACK